ncbi:3-oxoacyl-ACP reductase [Clostridia bacterium]|nr:3-oxoacyl-ACP reductase [Clostridia bacterium]
MIMNESRFVGKTAVISGAASGMGLLACQCLAREGARIVMCDVNENALNACAQDLIDNGGEVTPLVVDVRVYEQVKAAMDLAKQTYGSIDIISSFAGGASGRIFKTGEFKDTDIHIIDWGIDVNFKAQVYFAHAAIGYMFEQNTGVIINIGSITGEEGSGSAIDYASAKSGVMYGLTKSLAQYGASHNVRVCCISPGPVLTRESMANMRTLIGRAAYPQEIIDLFLYLCSDKAAFMTGVNILIDGGRNCLPKI